ncbi:hypothetical protein LDENG_00007900 [Lucifuga dentata]|nr:hypothetical protein LDENG_00007900 [Lucifuga dentata]
MENDDKYLPELLAEKDSLDSSFTHAMKLLNAEIDKIQKGDTKKDTESYLDLFTTKNIKLKERVLIPVKQYPKDMMDDICQEQFMEMSYLNGGQEHGGRGRGGLPVRGRGGLPAGASTEAEAEGACRGRGIPPRGGATRGGVTRGGPARGGAVRGAPAGRGGPPAAPTRGAAAPRARLPAAGPPQRMAPMAPQHTPAAATDSYEEYGYDESYTESTYESYDSYYSQPQAEPEYYDYGHGETTESYESYGQDDWNGTQRTAPGKALPPSRGAKTPYREHPYRQY